MEFKKSLTLGERIDVTYEGLSYKSIVQDVEPGGFVLISQITTGTVPIFIPTGSEAYLVFFRPDGMYHFPAVMCGHVVDGSLRMNRFEAIGEPIRWQRRHSFRLAVRLPVRIWYRDEEKPLEASQVELNTALLDISHTGLKFIAPYEIKNRQHVNCDIKLDEETSFSVVCEVKNVMPPSDKEKSFRIGVQFLNLSTRMQRYISKFIMNEQIKLHKRL